MMYCKAAGYIAGTENRLDAAVLKKIRREFGMSIRSPRFNQVLFGALGDLFARSGLDKDSFDKSAGLIVGSRLGPVGMVSAFQDEILDYPEDQVMAGTFANSVHNAPAGAVTVLLDIRGPAFSVMGFEDMLEQSLNLAELNLNAGTCPEILVMFGEESSIIGDAVKEVYAPFDKESAAAFLLTADPQYPEFRTEGISDYHTLFTTNIR